MRGLVKKYDLSGGYVRDGGYVNFQVSGKINKSIALGDKIGLEMRGNVVWVHEDVNFGEKDISDFVSQNFINGNETSEFIRKRL